MMVLLLAASCSKGETSYDDPRGDAEISFTSGELTADWGANSSTRGLVVEDINDLSSSVMVYSFVDNPNIAAPLINNVEATKAPNNVWSFNPAYYYPYNETLDFLAYSPKTDLSTNGLSQSLDFDKKCVTFSYAPPITVVDQPDLMLATPAKGCSITNQLGKLTFNHALTQISMKARVSNTTEANRYFVSGFTLHHITTAADLTYDVENGIGEWVSSAVGEFVFYVSSPDFGESNFLPVKLTDSYQNVINNDHTLLMIPQKIESNGGEIAPSIQVIIYDTKEGSHLTYETERISLPSPNGAGWVKGQHINLLFDFDVTNENLVIPMTVKTELIDWVEQDIDKEVKPNIYAYLSDYTISGNPTITLYTNGVATYVEADGSVVQKATLGAADSNGYYPISLTTLNKGAGSITVKIDNSREKVITKTFNVTVK